MDSQTGYTILGGVLSGLVGVSLFFLQRSMAGQDEQQNLLFQILQLMVLPARADWTGDMFGMSMQEFKLHEARIKEIKTLALMVKDKELAKEIYLYDKKQSDEKESLIKKLHGRINPKLVKVLEEADAARTAPKTAL
jgi:gas vesicle protein